MSTGPGFHAVHLHICLGAGLISTHPVFEKWDCEEIGCWEEERMKIWGWEHSQLVKSNDSMKLQDGFLTGFLKENEGKQNKQKKPTLQIGLEPFSIPSVEVLRVVMRPKDQRHTSGTIWASYLLEKIRTIFQSRLDNRMHIANSIQRRQKGDTSRLPGNRSPSLGEGGKEEVSVRENSPVVTVVSATYSPTTEGTRLRTLRGHGGWETVCSAENCHHNAWTVFSHPLPKNNEMARIQRSVILSSCFYHWQLITDSFHFYSAFTEHSHPWCEGR